MIYYIRHAHGKMDEHVLTQLAVLERVCSKAGHRVASAKVRSLGGVHLLVVVGVWGIVCYAN